MGSRSTSPREFTLRESKLPQLGAELTTRVALDTLSSVLADADFEREQEAIDGTVAKHTARAPAAA